MSEDIKELSPEQIKQALTAMHHGLLTLQARLDDHEKVLNKMMIIFDDLATARVPDGFRQPKAN